jgi:4-hydroxymandelate oxidase
VKGVLHPQDAVLAFEHGAAAVQVSNHGGRQLDGAIASLDALPAVVEAVRDRGPVLFDGGIRRGTDALMALALGATAVGIGRPILWGLAVDGEAGVGRVLDILVAELAHAMALAGAPSVGDLTPELVV